MDDTLHNALRPDAAHRRFRRLLLVVAGLYAAFVVYGSLLPFAFRPMPWSDAVARFGHTLSHTHYHTSRSDVAVNVLLMAPLGMLLTGAIAYRRSVLAAVLAALTAVAACAALSVTVEFAQTFFPPRTPSRTDIAAQLLGALLGVAVWFVMGRNLVDGLLRLHATGGPRDQAAALLPAYILLLVILQTVPFDFATSPVELYRKWRGGGVHLMPLVGLGSSPLDALNVALLNSVQYLPLGILARLTHSLRPRAGRWTHPAVLILAVPALAEAAQLAVLSRTADVTDILTGACGALAGWWATSALQWQPAGRRCPRVAIWILLGAAWLGVAMFVYWHPLDFNLSRKMFFDKLAAVSLVPLADYQSTTPYNAIDQCATKVLLFVPLGALLAAACPLHRAARHSGHAVGRHPRRACLPAVLAAAFVVAVLLETGQALLPSRYPGVTDVLLACLGSWAGFVVAFDAGSARTESMPSIAAAPSDTPLNKSLRTRLAV